MLLKNKSVLRRLNWAQVCEKVRKVNPALAAIIDELEPDDSHTLFEFTSPFGTEILRDGLLQLPDEEGEMIPLGDSQLDGFISSELSYVQGGMPLALMLKNNAELFLPIKNHNAILMSDILTPGRLFADRRLLDPTVTYHPMLLWHMTLGARSLFMLPKITSAINYRRLKKCFGMHFEAPACLTDHWRVFCELENHPHVVKPWTGKVLYFGRRWLEHLDDKAWARFNHYLYKNAWEATTFVRDKPLWEVVLSAIKRRANLRLDPYIADATSHLVAISLGAASGFAPAMNDDNGPISRLQTIFRDIYQLDLYEPIIMQPTFLNWQDAESSVYYSLNYPTTTGFSPRSRRLTNKIIDLAEIRHVINHYLAGMEGDRLQLSATPLGELRKRVNFEYFHSENVRSEGIQSTADIPVVDRNFSVKGSAAAFPRDSPFINGCVRIAVKKADPLS
jgi:hypothetical protein